MKLYFWCRITRCTGPSPKCHRFYAACGSDAETTGRFDDSVVFVGYATCFHGQRREEVAQAYIDDINRHARANGFNVKPWVIEIQEKEYRYYERRQNAWARGELV